MWKYELWCDGCALTSDDGFESQEEAEMEAQDAIENYIEMWKSDVQENFDEVAARKTIYVDISKNE